MILRKYCLPVCSSLAIQIALSAPYRHLFADHALLIVLEALKVRLLRRFDLFQPLEVDA